ncbi:MAG: hypothetical protein KDK36_20505 [Leptospiraceae bacterium]|nr:hypothetical protein [Leptospiraceae bacterium]
MELKKVYNEDLNLKQFIPIEPLTEEEKEGIVLAVKSAFLKLKNLYSQIVPIFNEYGFKPPSAGVIARDLSEKIEASIIQHCRTFNKGIKFADLARFGKRWEVKICKNSGLTINQSAIIDGENYIVVNYKDNSSVKKIWILWNAQGNFFTAKRSNSNARSIDNKNSKQNIEVIYNEK